MGEDGGVTPAVAPHADLGREAPRASAAHGRSPVSGQDMMDVRFRHSKFEVMTVTPPKTGPASGSLESGWGRDTGIQTPAQCQMQGVGSELGEELLLNAAYDELSCCARRPAPVRRGASRHGATGVHRRQALVVERHVARGRRSRLH